MVKIKANMPTILATNCLHEIALPDVECVKNSDLLLATRDSNNSLAIAFPAVWYKRIKQEPLLPYTMFDSW